MRAYQDMVFSTAARLLGDDAQAEDIAQDVFVKAFEQFARLRDSPTAGGWLRTVARHAALNHLTRRRRRWRLFSELPVTDEPLPHTTLPDTVLTQLEAGQRHVFIEEALRRLPHSQRVPLVLFHFEELSYEEIAAQLRVSLAKVKTDIHRGRAALLAALQARGIAHELALGLSPDALAE